MKLKAAYKYLIIIGVIISSCEYFKGSDASDEAEKVSIARVKQTYLYEDDLSGLTSPNMTSEDSTIRIKNYIDNWIKKQLLIDKAISQIEFNEAELERKVLDYRYALIVHEYEKFYVNQEISKDVTDEEIEEYYEEKYENFLLKQNIIRCLFAKVPKEAPRVSDLSQWMRRYPNSDIEEIQSYCYQFANKSSLVDTLWINFDEIIQNTVLSDIPNKVQFLKNNKYVEATDEEFIYLLKILDYKISDQISPLEFIRDDIRNIIINKRKISIKKDLEERIFKEARQNEEFEIF